jgi:hypothetical protein
MESVADQFITRCNIPEGTFDNIGKCRYEVPDYWTIGEVYERLIEDVSVVDCIRLPIENILCIFCR